MSPMILYLFKVNGVLLLFAIAYYCVLRNLTFYKVNRFYLLCGLLFSTVYPFIDLTALFYSQKSIDTNWIQYVPATSLDELAAPGFFWKVIIWVFYAGMMVMSFRFLLQLFSLRKIHSRSVQSANLGKKVRVLNEKIYPFTFWQTIYLNPAMHEDADLKVIMEHEKVHVKQWHTLDILLSQLSGIFYWFNPGIWFMKIFIKENLEFLTDDAVIKKGIEKKIYQYNVLKVEAGISAVALANGFNLSGIKRRIRMMNARQSSKSRLVVYFVLLPVIILFSLAFTISKVKQEPEVKMVKQSIDLNKNQPVIPEIIELDVIAFPVKTPPKKRVQQVVKNKRTSNIPKAQNESEREKITVWVESGSPEIRDIVSDTEVSGTEQVVKTITVKGFAAKTGNNEQNTDVETAKPEGVKKGVDIKSVQGFKIPNQDASQFPKLTYYVNGVKTPPNAAIGIKPESIQEISVFKKDGNSGDIYLKLKKGIEEKE